MALSRPAESSVGPYRTFYESSVEKFKKGTEKVIHSLGYFLGELQTHLKDMERISSEISEVNIDFALRLLAFLKDISALRDYYHVIYNNTKGVVNYGTSGIINNIRRLIREKRYIEVDGELDSFWGNLKKRIEKIESDIDKMKQDESVDCDEIEGKVNAVKVEYDAAKQQLHEEISHAQKKQNVLWKLGCSTFFYVAVGATAGGMLISCMPNTQIGEVMKQIAENVGTEIVTFCFGNTLKGLHSLTSNVPKELQEKVDKKTKEVNKCIFEFITTVTEFNTIIKTVVIGIDDVKKNNMDVRESLKEKPISEQRDADWESISGFLQGIYDSIMYLRQNIIEKEHLKMDQIHKAMDELTFGIDLVSKGPSV